MFLSVRPFGEPSLKVVCVVLWFVGRCVVDGRLECALVCKLCSELL